MSLRFGLLVVAYGGLLWVAMPLEAQSTRTAAQSRSRACRVDSTAQWLTRQRAWLGESKATWSNDSMRKAIIAALGDDTVTLRRPQLGAEFLMNDGVPL